VAVVGGGDRPVPLDFEYRVTPLLDSVQALLASGRAPIYIVHFTQKAGPRPRTRRQEHFVGCRLTQETRV